MANKSISELTEATSVNNQDLFVLEQGGLAKKMTAETFITEQGIIDALAEALDGHGGIQSVTLQSLSGRVRTYLITFTDGSATTFQVLDGTSITSIQKTSTAGLVDTYTVYMSDGTTSFFNVTNGDGYTTRVRPTCSAFMDEITAVKTYPVNNGRQISVYKNHITVTRTAAGTTYALMSLIGSGTSCQYSNISAEKVKALYEAGEFLPRDHYLYNLPDSNKKWYFNVSFFRPDGSEEGGTIYLTAYDTVNETYRYLASMSVISSFVQNESALSYLVDFSTLTENEVIMVLYYRRSGNASYRGVAAEWDWSLESARGISGDQDRQDNNLAWVETGTTASRAYAVGDFVTIGGILCEITAAVANGGTLTSGTNYTVIGGNGGLASTFNTEVDNDPCNALSSPFTSPLFSFVLIRCGKIRILTGDLSASTATASGATITTLKNAKDFPITDVLATSGNGGNNSLGLRITTSGELVTYGAASGAKTYQAFSIVYCV